MFAGGNQAAANVLTGSNLRLASCLGQIVLKLLSRPTLGGCIEGDRQPDGHFEAAMMSIKEKLISRPLPQ
jgi:hypothetical protein